MNRLLIKDYNFEYVETQVIRPLVLYKCLELSTYNLIGIKDIYISFFFRQVVDLDFINIYRYAFLLWLITGKACKIYKLTEVFRLRIYYYCFKLEVILKKNIHIFNFIYVLINKIMSKVEKLWIRKQKKNIEIRIKDLEMFTNLRIASDIYFYSVKEPMQIWINYHKELNDNIYKFNVNMLEKKGLSKWE